jgi:hypothetical protein
MLAGLSAVVLILVHVTAVVPFITLVCFFFIYNMLEGNFLLKENYKYFLVTGMAIFVFFNKRPIFTSLYFPSDVLAALPTPTYNKASLLSSTHTMKLLKLFDSGILSMLKQEIRRWRSYFIFINIGAFFAFVSGTFILLKQSCASIVDNKKGLSFLLAILVGCLAFMLLNPHGTWRHAIALIPFLFFMLASVFQKRALSTNKYRYLLVCFALVSSFHSIYLANHLIKEGKKNGYSIFSASELFDQILPDKNKTYLILGPTEIWPFIKPHKNVLIVDIRNGKQFERIDPIIDSVDYIVINNDYRKWKFKESFFLNYPSHTFDTEYSIGDGEVFLQILKRRKA